MSPAGRQTRTRGTRQDKERAAPTWRSLSSCEHTHAFTVIGEGHRLLMTDDSQHKTEFFPGNVNDEARTDNLKLQ